MEPRIDNETEKLWQEIEKLKARNLKVEAEKAWEVSYFRILSIALITYIIASVVLYFIGVPNFYLSALIPTVGYVLSTQSLPFVKRRWIERHTKSGNI